MVSHMSDVAVPAPDTPAKVKRVIRSKAAAKPTHKSAAKPVVKKAGLAAKPRARTPGSTDEQAEQIAALRRAAARLRREVTSDPAARRALLKRIAPKAAPHRG